MELVEIKTKKIRPDAVIPTSGSSGSAGSDLYACIDEPITIKPGEVAKIGIGLKMAIPDGCFGAIFARSGLATNEQLVPANAVGVCDSDYRGEYIVALINNGNCERTIVPGERIAQLIIMPYVPVCFKESEDLDETERGEGGFGSTGK